MSERMNALTLLEDYMLIPAGSGYESLMAYRLKHDLSEFSEDVSLDRLGNVISFFEGRDKNAPSVMLFAHMDQIGFIVTNIDEKGYLRLNKNGSVPDKVVPGQSLMIRNRKGDYFPGVVAEKAYHIMSNQEKETVTPIPSLYVDLGMKSKDEVLSNGIGIGCSVVFKPFFQALENNYITGTSIDNRGGCAALVLSAEKIAGQALDSDVYIVGTVQEEHNMHGAQTAANTIHPDIAIALDVCLASDSPGLEGVFDSVTGGGPAINMYSFHGRGTLNGVVAHQGLADLISTTAEENSIAYSWFASRGLLTDATYVQNIDKGVATIDLSFPVKYAHSPCEVCNLDDITALSDLCARTLLRINRNFSLNRF